MFCVCVGLSGWGTPRQGLCPCLSGAGWAVDRPSPGQQDQRFPHSEASELLSCSEGAGVPGPELRVFRVPGVGGFDGKAVSGLAPPRGDLREQGEQGGVEAGLVLHPSAEAA